MYFESTLIQTLIGPWLIYSNTDGLINLARHPDPRQMGNDKEKTLFFEERGRLSGKISYKSILPNTKGKWKLKEDNSLELKHHGHPIAYDLIYLSETSLIIQLK